MHVPKWAIALNVIAVVLLAAWAVALSFGKNPLPWPDPGSRIFAASSPEGKAAIVQLLSKHGVDERFEVNSSGILRSVMWDGTIVNHSPDAFMQKIGNSSSAIGLVSNEPLRSAQQAAEFLRAKGFKAEVIESAEPGMPVHFVITDAMLGTALNFRPPVTQMPAPE
ncbi:MAG: hypothetical protein EOP58_00150 [Sphingomonadales bacterium]|nr:MAG: hypothetical protein EOP58_00150 [Sphingomonadales bacterium]